MDILAILQRLGGGHFLEEVADAITETADEVVATGKPAKVTITLAVTTPAQGETLITIEETVSRTVPKRAPRGAMFYAVDGELYREDPRQATLPGFRTVDDAESEIRDLGYGDDQRVVGTQ